jgi:hypothetical protein
VSWTALGVREIGAVCCCHAGVYGCADTGGSCVGSGVSRTGLSETHCCLLLAAVAVETALKAVPMKTGYAPAVASSFEVEIGDDKFSSRELLFSL